MILISLYPFRQSPKASKKHLKKGEMRCEGGGVPRRTHPDFVTETELLLLLLFLNKKERKKKKKEPIEGN